MEITIGLEEYLLESDPKCVVLCNPGNLYLGQHDGLAMLVSDALESNGSKTDLIICDSSARRRKKLRDELKDRTNIIYMKDNQWTRKEILVQADSDWTIFMNSWSVTPESINDDAGFIYDAIENTESGIALYTPEIYCDHVVPMMKDIRADILEWRLNPVKYLIKDCPLVRDSSRKKATLNREPQMVPEKTTGSIYRQQYNPIKYPQRGDNF